MRRMYGRVAASEEYPRGESSVENANEDLWNLIDVALYLRTIFVSLQTSLSMNFSN